MAEAIILEFEGIGAEDYRRVNELLGIDSNTGEGDWPDGLITHSAAASASGWVVFEVWDSVEAQERFMEERLAAALQQGGVEGPPSRAEWLNLEAHHHPGS